MTMQRLLYVLNNIPAVCSPASATLHRARVAQTRRVAPRIYATDRCIVKLHTDSSRVLGILRALRCIYTQMALV